MAKAKKHYRNPFCVSGDDFTNISRLTMAERVDPILQYSEYKMRKEIFERIISEQEIIFKEMIASLKQLEKKVNLLKNKKRNYK